MAKGAGFLTSTSFSFCGPSFLSTGGSSGAFFAGYLSGFTIESSGQYGIPRARSFWQSYTVPSGAGDGLQQGLFPHINEGLYANFTSSY